jgi:ABC-type multidrug transport system permease subunit
VSLHLALNALNSESSSSSSVMIWAAVVTRLEVSGILQQQPILDRHHRNAMYHPWVEALALSLAELPPVAAILAMFSTSLLYDSMHINLFH